MKSWKALFCGVVLSSALGAAIAGEPPKPVPTTDYGIDPKTGVFVHPNPTPYTAYDGQRPVKGSLPYLEQKEYINNMKVEGHWPIIVRPGTTWFHTVDMNGRRYLFHYYRTVLNIYDVTEPAKMQVVLHKEYKDGSWFGSAAIAYNQKLKKYIMLQSFEIPRSLGGMDGKKYSVPGIVEEAKKAPGFRGIRVYELTSPTEWKQIGEVTMNLLNPHSPVMQGGGAYAPAVYTGGKYAYFLGAPDDTFVHMENPNQIYSPIHMIYDVEDPANPKLVSSWWVPGQRLGEEDAYNKWPRAGDQTSWTGGRQPMQVPTPFEKGGKYAFTAVGSLGFHVLDISDPGNPKEIGSLDLPPSLAGHEGNDVDASRAFTRGIVLVNGYPMNEDCYEGYKDTYIIDVKDLAHPKIISKLPRPMPPKTAPYSDFCLRRGKFGPKESSWWYSPGTPDPNITIYPFYNGGVQVFDISDVLHPKVVAYYVQPMGPGTFDNPGSYNTPIDGMIVEWDRKLIWVSTTNGLYLLSTPALGKPVMSAPTVPAGPGLQ